MKNNDQGSQTQRFSKKVKVAMLLAGVLALVVIFAGLSSRGQKENDPTSKLSAPKQTAKQDDLQKPASLMQVNLDDGDEIKAAQEHIEPKTEETLEPPKPQEDEAKEDDKVKPTLLAPNASDSVLDKPAEPQAVEDPLQVQRAQFLANVEAQRAEKFLTATVAQISLNINNEGQSSGVVEGDVNSADLEIANVRRQINASTASYQQGQSRMPDSGSQVLDISSYQQQPSYDQGGGDPGDFNFNMRHGGQNAYSNMQNKGSWDLEKSLETPNNPYILRAGMVIPATMISGINSDLPGQIIAQVSQNVYDTATGKFLLLPQGTRLVGTYDSGITYGQERVMIAWQRLIYPDNRTLDLGAMPGSDVSGYSGFTDQVNNHWWKLISNAFLMSGVVAAVSVSVDDNNNNSENNSSTNMSDSLRTSLASQFGDVIARVISRNLSVSPTLEIRPGYKFNVMVTKDINFQSSYKLFDY